MAKRFSPEGAFSAIGLLQTLMAGALAAVVIGYALGWVGAKWMSLIIVWPLAMGGACGAVVSFLVRRTAIRHRLVAFLLGALSAALSYAASHHVAYLLARSEFKQMAVTQGFPTEEGLLKPTAEQADELFDIFLREQTGSDGLWGFVKMEAKEGSTISRHGSKGVNLGETGTWILFACELMLAVVVGGLIPRATAGRPFCASCGVWYQVAQRIPLAQTDGREIVRLLEADDVSRLAAAAAASAPGQPHLLLELLDCPQCDLADTVVEAQAVSFEKKKGTPKKRSLGLWVLPRAEAANLFKLARQKIETPTSPPAGSG